MRFFKFLAGNFAYLIWSCIYLIVTWALFVTFFPSLDILISTLIVIGIFAFSVLVALSPIGEWILKIIYHVRPVSTQREQDYLYPIFDEVYQQALEQYPKLNKKIRLHICDDMTVNAFALGRHTIAIHRGAINTFSPEELKGIIGHELGHIYYGHTKVLMLSVVGNMIFSGMVLAIRLFLFIFDLIVLIFSANSGTAFIGRLITIVTRFGFDCSIFIFIMLGNIILGLNSRSNEYQADKFSYDTGFGENLISALYILQDIDMNYKPTLKERLIASHPHLTKRITRLEQMSSTDMQAVYN